MQALIKHILSIRIVRYGLIGGFGIPINDLALFFFTHIIPVHLIPNSFAFYLLASALAFEVSNIINFALNQLFTYREQKIRGWEWGRRLLKGQLTSLSAMLLSWVVAGVLVYFHANEYIANPAGIIVAFGYNYFISKKLVFKATHPTSHDDDIAQVDKAELEALSRKSN
jgi:putative flippase GtrA